MKKVLKIVLILVVVLVGIAAIFVAYIQYKGIPSYKVEQVSFDVKSTPKKVKKGKKMAIMLCSSCHLNFETGTLVGREMNETKEFGKIVAPNITNHPTKGAGKYTDGELAYLIRTGIKKDGQYAPPYMAKLPHLANEDLEALIAFLRSDDKLVTPSDTVLPKSEPNFLTKALSNFVWKPFPYPTEVIPPPNPADTVAHGRYLAVNYECFSCHSANFQTNDYLNPEKSVGYFGGGIQLKNLDGETVAVPNITLHETGIGSWSEADFVNAVRFARRPDDMPILPPMIPYNGLSNQEVKAIYAYLKTIKPIENLVKQ